MIFRLVILALFMAGFSIDVFCMKSDRIVRENTRIGSSSNCQGSKGSKKKSRKKSDQGPVRKTGSKKERPRSLQLIGCFFLNRESGRDKLSPEDKFYSENVQLEGQFAGLKIGKKKEARRRTKSRILPPSKTSKPNKKKPRLKKEVRHNTDTSKSSNSIINSVSRDINEAFELDRGSDLVMLLTSKGANSLLKNRGKFMPKNENLIRGEINSEAKKWFEKAACQGKVNCLFDLAAAFPKQCDLTQVLSIKTKKVLIFTTINAKNKSGLLRLLKKYSHLAQEKYLIQAKNITGTLFDLLVDKQLFEWCDAICSKCNVRGKFDIKKFKKAYEDYRFQLACKALRTDLKDSPPMPRLNLSDVSSGSTDSMDMNDGRERVEEKEEEGNRFERSLYNPVLSGPRVQNLHKMFEVGKLSQLKKIIKLGADRGGLGLFYEQDAIGNTPLHYLFLNMISAKTTKKICNYFTIYSAVLEQFSIDAKKLEALENKQEKSCFTITSTKGNTVLHRLAYLFACEKDIAWCKKLVNVIIALTKQQKIFEQLILSQNKKQQKPFDFFVSYLQKKDPHCAYKTMIAKNSLVLNEK